MTVRYARRGIIISKDIMTMVVLISIVVWIGASQEAVKPSKEINWRKLKTLLTAGTLMALIITISLYQSLTF